MMGIPKSTRVSVLRRDDIVCVIQIVRTEPAILFTKYDYFIEVQRSCKEYKSLRQFNYFR